MAATTFKIAGLDGSPVDLRPEHLRELSSSVDGGLLFAGDPGWDGAVRIWNGMIARVPAVVAQPTSAAEVAAAVAFARDHRLILSIKGGGHNIAGTSVADGGLMLDMSHMRDVTVEADARLVHVGPGCLLGEVDRATQEHGLATVLGFVSETGVAGLTLGGGLGYLTRRFGYAVDSLEEVDIITADGTLRTASRAEDADLFWAIRGGGGNFGVVTRFTFRLHAVGPMVYGGLIAWPFDRYDEVAATYRALTEVAPRELAAWLVMLRAPAAPFVPEPWHGRRVCAMPLCYSGDLDLVDDVMAPLRAVGDPVIDLLGEQPYTQVQSYLDATEPKGFHYYWKTNYVTELSDGLLSAMKELSGTCPIPDGQIGLLHIGGALNDRAPDDGAVGNRDVQFALGVNGMWEPGSTNAEEFRTWIREASARVLPYTTGRTYINFQTADEEADRVRSAYGSNFERLLSVKLKYDPGNLFRVNRNIRAEAV